MQTGKRELRCLHADVVDVEIRRIGLLNRLAEHNLCCGLNKVAFHNLRHKRERTRCAQVALNHLNLVIFSKILNVERSADVQLFGYLLAYLFDAACCCQIDVLCGEHQRCVARVDARKLNVLRDGVLVNLAVLGHGVELYLLGILHKLRNHNRILLRHFGGGVQEGAHLVLVVADVHCRAREHVRRTNQHGEAHLVNKLVNLLETCQSLPARLVDAQLVEHCRELVAVFGAVNRHRRCAQNRHVLTVEVHCQVVRNLSAHRHNHALRNLKVDDVEHALKRQLVEVQAVAHIVVGADRFGVVVNHYRLVAQFASRLDGVYRAPVELNA